MLDDHQGCQAHSSAAAVPEAADLVQVAEVFGLDVQLAAADLLVHLVAVESEVLDLACLGLPFEVAAAFVA